MVGQGGAFLERVVGAVSSKQYRTCILGERGRNLFPGVLGRRYVAVPPADRTVVVHIMLKRQACGRKGQPEVAVIYSQRTALITGSRVSN